MAKEGNPNPTGGKPDKLIRDALKAALRQDPRHLKQIAEAWVERAKIDQNAANALTDRIDGKVPQPVSGDDESPLAIIHRIERTIIDPKNDNASNPDT